MLTISFTSEEPHRGDESKVPALFSAF
jgi:hypothetical protein